MQGFLNNREEFEVWRPISCKWGSVPVAGTGRDLFLKVESKFQREKCQGHFFTFQGRITFPLPVRT